MALTAAALFVLPAAQAGTDPFGDLLEAPGSAGLGAVVRIERSPYEGGGTRYDLVPQYLYEGERVFLHASRLGFKAWTSDAMRVDLFVDQRFEGFPTDRIPPALTGLANRDAGIDAGIAWRLQQPWGTVQAELLHDVSNTSHGTEARLGYSYAWRSGKLQLRPSAIVSWRNARLNDYYYGVAPGEATAARPAYAPGAGTNLELGLYGTYDLSDGWRLLGGVSATFLDRDVRNSPIVRNGVQQTFYVGAAYDFGSHKRRWDEENSPTWVKVLHGRASADGCHLIRIATLRCLDTDRTTPTSINGIQIGKPFIEQFHGWPLDFTGYVGLTQHDERGQQRNGLQVDAMMKAFYYGFPWRHRVNTRVGLGAGVSVAQRAPYTEVVGQAGRGHQTSRVLNYLDPTIDFSLGDAFGVRSLKNTYFGVGVSHRSGIFGSSRLLGNVNGGSNYLYTYLETAL